MADRPIRRLSLGRVTLADRERHFARLDDLLRRRAESLRRTGPEQRARDGFTLIELLLVISVILILVGMTISHLGASLRRAGVDAAASEILAAADMARQLALQDNGVGQASYGVRIADEKGETAYVAVIVRDPDGIRLAPGAEGEPLHYHPFPSAAIVWKGESDLQSDSDPVVEWFYGNGSGKVCIEDGAELSTYPVEVGTVQTRIDRTWGEPLNSGWSPVVCPGNGAAPGLSVRSSDGSFAVAVAVQSSGIAVRERFDRIAGAARDAAVVASPTSN